MALQIATVASSIAALNVAGLSIKDIDEIPMTGDVRSALLIPNIAYISDFEVVRDSTGAAEALMTVSYTLNYRLLYKQSGEGRTNIFEYFAGMIEMIAAFWDAVLAIAVFAGAVDIVPLAPANVGQVNAPDEVAWWGCDLSLRITEFVN